MFGERHVVGRSDGPLTIQDIKKGLQTLGLASGQVVLVHVSLSRLGWICGGAQAVIEALHDVVGVEGTIVMPAFSSGWTEPSYWQAPAVPESWWEEIRAHHPAFDPLKTPTRGLGRTAELFRTYPNVVRGPHPQVSFAALGQDASAIVSEHPLDFPLGEKGPLGHLYDLDASILLLGCDYDSCTALHLAERQASFDRTREVVEQGAAMVLDGSTRQWVTFDVIETDHDDFSEVGDAFESKCMESWSADTIGIGVARLISLRDLVDFAKTWFETHRGVQSDNSCLEKSGGLTDS